MTSHPPKLAQVAKAAGVSVSTASSALSGRGRIADSTRARVLQVAAKLGYRTNLAAKTLRTVETTNIALIIDSAILSNGRGAHRVATYRFLATLINDCTNAGAGLTVLTTANTDVAERVDADVFILFAREYPIRTIERLGFGIPVITVGMVTEDPRVAARVTQNNLDSTVEVLDHLWDNGSRAPAFFIPTGWGYARSARASYAVWCHQRGIKPLIVELANGRDIGEDADKLSHAITWALEAGADGIYSLGLDANTPALLAGLQKAGKRVPVDVLVVAVSDGLIEPHLDPPVTTLSFDGTAMGAAASQLAQELLHGNTGSTGVGRHIEVANVFTPRRSTRR